MRDIFRGANALLRGYSLLGRREIRGLVAGPFLLALLLYAILLWIAQGQVAALEGWLGSSLPGFLSWLTPVVTVSTWIAMLLLVAVTFSLAASILGAPFHGFLAERVERVLTGRTPEDVSFARALARLPGVLVQETRKLLYALLLSIPFLLLLLVPLVGSALWVLWGAWLTALAFCDYALDNHDHSFRTMRRLLREHWPASFGFGALTLLALTVPVLNLFTVPAAVIGGTILTLEVFEARSGRGVAATRRTPPPPVE